MKTDEQRGPFGAWLTRERHRAGFKNVPSAVDALQRQAGYGIAVSVWAELESGSRRPNEEQRQRLTAFFGTTPEPAPSPSDGDIAALVSAIRAQADAINALAEAIREDRDRVSPEALRAFLEQLRSEGLLATPGIPASTDVVRQPEREMA